MGLTERTKGELRIQLERAMRSATEADNVDALVDAAMGRLDWDDLGCKVLGDVLSEENTDALIDAFWPKLQELVDRALGKLGWVVRFLPFVNLHDRIRTALDDALPELIRDPLQALVCGGEEA